jgi:hypothetical protein
MRSIISSLAVASCFLAQAISAAALEKKQNYVNWKTFEANGVNLGGWLVQESTIDTAWQ